MTEVRREGTVEVRVDLVVIENNGGGHGGGGYGRGGRHGGGGGDDGGDSGSGAKEVELVEMEMEMGLLEFSNTKNG